MVMVDCCRLLAVFMRMGLVVAKVFPIHSKEENIIGLCLIIGQSWERISFNLMYRTWGESFLFEGRKYRENIPTIPL